jgi:hypothetical protein
VIASGDRARGVAAAEVAEPVALHLNEVLALVTESVPALGRPGGQGVRHIAAGQRGGASGGGGLIAEDQRMSFADRLLTGRGAVAAEHTEGLEELFLVTAVQTGEPLAQALALAV